MATKSFLKTINLKSKTQAQAFIRAAEKSLETRQEPKKQLPVETARELTKEQIQRIFCENQDTKEPV